MQFMAAHPTFYCPLQTPLDPADLVQYGSIVWMVLPQCVDLTSMFLLFSLKNDSVY